MSVKSATVIARLHFPSGPLFSTGDRYHDERIIRVTLVNENLRKLGETDHRSPMETTYNENAYLSRACNSRPYDEHA